LMDLKSRDDVFDASVTKIEIDGVECWHLEVLERGELLFDYNGSLEECLDWPNRLGRRR
jgi:hypothetical protein